LYEDKRLDLLLETGAKLADLVPGFRLHILGDGPLRNSVVAAEGEWLEFHGRLTGSEKGLLVSRCLFFLNPGLVGLVAIDSLASGRPLLTCADSRHSPEIEYIADGYTGIIARDGADFARKAYALLMNPEEVERLSVNCLTESQNYTLDAMVGRFASGVRRIACRSSDPPPAPSACR
jgi:glycosyltransferase involved in cell wall biosynthesis